MSSMALAAMEIKRIVYPTLNIERTLSQSAHNPAEVASLTIRPPRIFQHPNYET